MPKDLPPGATRVQGETRLGVLVDYIATQLTECKGDKGEAYSTVKAVFEGENVICVLPGGKVVPCVLKEILDFEGEGKVVVSGSGEAIKLKRVAAFNLGPESLSEVQAAVSGNNNLRKTAPKLVEAPPPPKAPPTAKKLDPGTDLLEPDLLEIYPPTPDTEQHVAQTSHAACDDCGVCSDCGGPHQPDCCGEPHQPDCVLD